jgi:phospholipid/cholesterol/gamma-HCH transport system substrate-binding protein
METRASYVLIGAFALAIFVGAFGFVLWLGKLSLEREWTYYDIVFEEPVTGLSVGGAVQYNGIQVGEVRKLSLAPKDPRRAIAHVRLNADTPVKIDTHARLNLVGLTGVTVIQLSGGSPDAPALQAAAGESAARIVADVSALQSLLASGQDMALGANEALARVGKLLSDDNLDHVAASLRHIDEMTQTLAAQKQELHEVLANLRGASAQLQRTLAGMERTAASADTLLQRHGTPLIASAQAWLASAQRTTDAATALLDGNREPIARFTHDGLGELTPAIAELRATLRALRGVSSKLQADPGAYVTGRERTREFVPP